MKKLLTFLTLLTVFIGVGWANDATFSPSDFSGQGISGTGGAISATVDGVTFACDKGYGTTQIRCYSGGTITISSDNTITGISFNFSGSYTGGLNSSYTGLSTNSWEQALTSQARITSVTVTYTTGSSQITEYDVTCNSAENGSISVGSTTSYAEGATVTVTATPQTGYKLSTVTVTPSDNEVSAPDVTISGNSATFTMPASDVEVDATFEETLAVQYKLVEDENDLVSGAEYLLVGSTNTAPYSGILGDISSNIGSVATTGFTYNSSEKTITVEDNCSATPLTLGGSAGAWTLHNGTAYLSYTGSNNNLYAINDATAATAKWIIYTDVFPSSKLLIANANSTSRYIAYNSGTNPKRFACYTGTGLNSVSPISLFKKVETGDYTITIDDAIENGTVTASRESANANDPVTVTVTPEPGYELSTLTVDGTDVTSSVSNNSYTFNMPAHSVTITATFALKKNKVEYTVSPANTGEVWLTSGTTYDQSLGYSYSTMGTTVGIALAAYPGYDVNSLTITDEGGATVSYTTYNSEWNDGKWVTYYTFVMPATPVNIAATFKSGDIYILGTANDNPWNGNKGVKMTFDAGTNTYSANVYFATTTDTGKGQFSFASNLSGNDGDENGDGSWNNIGKRWGAPSQDYDLVTNANGGNWTENNSDPNRFAVPYGVYEIKVNWGTGLVTATKKDITVTLDKASGQLETGTTVNVASNLSTLLQSCKNGVSATLAYSTDDGASYTDGNSFVVNSNMTAKGKAYYGTIEAESDAYDYTVVTHYPVTATANPTAGGTVSVSPASALAGETVTITATPKSGYQLESITVNGTAIEPNEGVYSFTMPAQATEVVANFSKIQYAITKAETKCTIDITDGVTVTDGNITAGAGDLVKFTVTPISNKYYVSSVTLVWGDGTTTTTPALTDGVYSFNMQARPVTITAVCEREAVGDGSFVLVTDASTLKAGDKVIITNSGIAGSALAMAEDRGNNRGSVTVTITSDLKITPNAILPAEGGVQVLTLESATATVNGQTTNAWMFNTGGQYLYAASSGSNYLKTASADVAGENGKATITIGNSNNNYNAVITFRGSNTRNIIRNNGSLFACYSSGQSPVYIYKQTAAGLMVEIDPDGGQVIGSQEVTIDANVEGAMVQYKIGDGEWSTPAEAPVTTTITGNVGDQVVVYAKATMEDEDETLEDETSSNFTFVAPAAPTITPASCNISSETQNVTIASNYDNGTIEYSTDGGTTWNAYTGQFHVIIEGVGESATVQARVTVNGVTSDVASATYTRGVQPVVFSPASGDYYHSQTCQMFSTTKGARIYYTTDGSDPVMNQGTTQLYTGEIEMTPGNTYNFKAVAYIGTTPSAANSADYVIKTGDYPGSNNYLYSVAELNAKDATTDNWTMVNPVQVIYMSTYQQNGYQPEYCLVRDNTGYGMIYFGKQNASHDDYKIFEMGDWISGGYYGPISNFKYTPTGESQQVTADTHPELGTSTHGVQIHNWSSNLYKSNSTVLPEYLDIQTILSSDPTDASKDYWGHYVHLRKNTVVLSEKDKDNKWSGTITDENGNDINYYDKFYLQCNENWTTTDNFFTGHPNRTFDVYGFVAYFRGDYQISPFDFAWIDQPVIDKETTTYYEPQTVTISSPDDQTATIWYKTSEMDDFHVYTEPFEVNSTTTVEWYATKQSQYNDELESLRGSITMTFDEIAKPVITPESQVKAVGESVDASIAYEEGKTVPPIAVILYTTDGSDPKTSETAQEYTLGTTLTFTTTTTVRAITRVGNLYSAEADAKTYTFVKSNGIEYTLIDDVTKLKENGVYVIVSQNYSEAISTTQNVNNRGAAGVLFVEGTNKAKVYGNDDVAQFTLSVLTHDEDTSPERHFLMQTNNSNVNGYLYVGHDVNNSLMTEAEEDAMGNDVAVITIDSDGRAHIHFNYAGGDNRYLQYWNRDRLFNTYKSEYDDRAVYIYGVEATPLATIEKEGKSGQDYTVADELVGVYFDQSHPYLLWCKDQGNVSIAKSNLAEGEIDFLHDVVDQNKFAAWEDCDQSNWVILDFSGVTGVHNDPEEFLGKYIAPASITGTYTKDTNYKIALKQAPTLNEGSASYTNNVYVATNFVATYQNPGYNGRRVLNPKGTEVHTITYAVWNGSGFSTPETTDMPGSITVDWTYNANPDIAEDLIVNSIYEFTATVGLASTTPSGVPGLKVKEPIPATGYVLQPLDLSTDKEMDPTTGISGITNGKAVKSIKYVNVAGIVSDVPFQGVNIVVTEYTDGSRTTSKMLRK